MFKTFLARLAGWNLLALVQKLNSVLNDTVHLLACRFLIIPRSFASFVKFSIVPHPLLLLVWIWSNSPADPLQHMCFLFFTAGLSVHYTRSWQPGHFGTSYISTLFLENLAKSHSTDSGSIKLESLVQYMFWNCFRVFGIFEGTESEEGMWKILDFKKIYWICRELNWSRSIISRER